MSSFANQAAFDRPASRAAAAGINLLPAQAIVDLQGRVLAHARTGGMINPQRHPLMKGTRLFRFGRGNQSPQDVARGAWWLEAREFELLVSFAKDQTPTVLATGADPAAPQTWRIVRDKQPPAGAYLHGKVSVKLVPQKPQLTMTVRDQGLKKGDAPNANSATYTVTFDLCSARTLERLKAKPQ